MRKKRPDGEGTIEQLPSGKHRVKFTTNTGGRDSTTAYATEEEAEGVRRAIVERLASENPRASAASRSASTADTASIGANASACVASTRSAIAGSGGWRRRRLPIAHS